MIIQIMRMMEKTISSAILKRQTSTVYVDKLKDGTRGIAELAVSWNIRQFCTDHTDCQIS